jgi:hypothetical protein
MRVEQEAFRLGQLQSFVAVRLGDAVQVSRGTKGDIARE